LVSEKAKLIEDFKKATLFEVFRSKKVKPF
jgi:hypothetical protein